MPTGMTLQFCKGRMEFFPFQNSLHGAIQTITRADSEGNSVPGEGKIYILEHEDNVANEGRS